MRSIQIVDSYDIWGPTLMKACINVACKCKYGSWCATEVLRRSYADMLIEWWLRNLGYYLTKPFCCIAFIREINMRCANVDLESRGVEDGGVAG